MSTYEIFDTSAALEASGGDDTLTEAYDVDSDTAAVQLEATGDSTDFDFVIDVRLASDVGWAEDFASLKNKSAPLTEVVRVDLEAITEIRARVVNNDGNDTVDARVIGRTWD